MASVYHHGNLRQALLGEADRIIETDGIDALSVRKLADNVGVSRTALYHHFRDKNALLSAITEAQFSHWGKQLTEVLDDQAPIEEQIKVFAKQYLYGATERPAHYNLMFGKPIWKSGEPSESLTEISRATFQNYVILIKRWQDLGAIEAAIPPLQLAQVSWGMLHGLARLLIDGVYVDHKQIEEMSDAVTRLLLNGQAATPSSEF